MFFKIRPQLLLQWINFKMKENFKKDFTVN